ncbi:MAG TPA: outer membrane beta-barrel domain-containing protein [Polyangiaceae bacterium]
MNKTRVGLLVALALGIFPANAGAQVKAGAKASASASTEGEAAAEGEAKAGAEGEAPAEGEAAATGDAATGDTGAEGSGLEDICKIDPAACPNLDMEKEAARKFNEPLYAVQQIFALRVRRFELNPYWGISLNDQFVSHPAPGLAFNYYITNVLAIGVNGAYYEPFNVDQDFNAEVRRAARVAVPLTEYQWAAALNFQYVPAYGKFAGFGDFIFHYDAYVVGGVGAISTRPIPVIDPDNRNFQFDTKLSMNVGIGLRVFLNRWFAAMFELRDYIYPEQLESLEESSNPADPSTWYGDTKWTNNVQAQLGVSIFIPFSFDYRLPK